MNVLDTGISSANENMRLDVQLLEELKNHSECLLHLYEWQGKCATYGHFIDPNKYLQADETKKYQLELAKRPTGGGIIFHCWDFTFSFLIPKCHPRLSTNTLENYANVNTVVRTAIKEFLGTHDNPQLMVQSQECSPFCMAKPTIYDVMLDGKKVGGAAQRRTRHGILHQGSISLFPPDEVMLKDLLNEKVVQAMQMNSCSLLSHSNDRDDTKNILKSLLLFHFKKF